MSGLPLPTFQDLIREGAGYLEALEVPSPRFDAQILLSHVLGVSRSELLRRRDETAGETVSARFREQLRRRGERVPLQYLTGEQEFWSLPFAVSPAVLIPRPETEILVEEALRHLTAPTPHIADVGTGSGNIAVALARELPGATLYAIDISARALELARRNALRHHVGDRIRFLEGSLCAPLEGIVPPESLDLLVSNPPYVRADELAALAPEVRDHEPLEALSPPEGGALSLYPQLLDAGQRWLKPGGHLLLELPAGGAEHIPEIMAGRDGLELLTVRPDYSGILRVMVARRRRP